VALLVAVPQPLAVRGYMSPWELDEGVWVSMAELLDVDSRPEVTVGLACRAAIATQPSGRCLLAQSYL
jgi:hypothetical protein